MNVLITGATGMVGSEAVRQAINDTDISRIFLVVRRDAGFTDPKVHQVIIKDFTSYSGLEDIFKQTDACMWCLGISQSRVSRNHYYAITHDYVVAAAKAMLAVNSDIVFIFLSAEGADSKERSPVRFSRVKGQAENALIRLNPKRLYIFRPGGILPSVKVKGQGFYKFLEILAVKLMAAVFPWSVISTRELALGMLKIAKEGYGKTILSHRNIRNL